MSLVMSRWFPSHERASAVGISMAGFHLGNVFGLLLTPVMLSTMGLSGPFILFSSIGLLWLTIWAYTVTNDPRENRYISNSEIRMIQAGKSDSPKKDGKLPSMRLLFSKLPTWAIICANITNNWVSFSNSFYCGFHPFFSAVQLILNHGLPYRGTSFCSHGCRFILRR